MTRLSASLCFANKAAVTNISLERPASGTKQKLHRAALTFLVLY